SLAGDLAAHGLACDAAAHGLTRDLATHGLARDLATHSLARDLATHGLTDSPSGSATTSCHHWFSSASAGSIPEILSRRWFQPWIESFRLSPSTGSRGVPSKRQRLRARLI